MIVQPPSAPPQQQSANAKKQKSQNETLAKKDVAQEIADELDIIYIYEEYSYKKNNYPLYIILYNYLYIIFF